MTRGLTVVCFCLASFARAHDTWILPASDWLHPGAAASFEVTSGMAFPARDQALAADRVAATAFRLRGKTSTITNPSAGAHALKLTATFRQSGIATVWAESKARFIELTRDQVEEYLTEVGLADTIGREWKSGDARAKWRENYTKHAKTFVRVGEPGRDSSWKDPVGMALEVVPEQDPTVLSSGSRLTVRLLKDGKPLPSFPVSALASGSKAGSIQSTDADGRVTMTLDRTGWWLLRATHIERSARTDADWESHFTTLTFRVRPRS